MRPENIVVIGGSAGALPIFKMIAGELPPDLPAAVFVVSHIPPDVPSRLPEILNRESGPRAVAATDGAAINSSTIYIAPPDRHLLIANGHIQLTKGPRENRARPAIDPLFRSAAKEYGARVIAVLLSGVLDDGLAGLQEVKKHGGTVLVLDPNDSLFPQMPENAIQYDGPDYVLRRSEIAPTIVQLIQKAERRHQVTTATTDQGPVLKPSGYICPDCGGGLFESTDDNTKQFRCRVGHAYSPQALAVADTEALESKLWAAVHALEQHAEIDRKVAARLETHDKTKASTLRQESEARMQHAKLLREVVLLEKDQ